MLDKEKSIYRAQMEGSGKPANVIDKIVEGKLGSYYAQVVLPDQPSIRDPKMTVADVIAAANKTLGASVTVTRFARLKVGEGRLRSKFRVGSGFWVLSSELPGFAVPRPCVERFVASAPEPASKLPIYNLLP